MPFRIENILKKDAHLTYNTCKSLENEKVDNAVKNNQSGSILQQTLLNRLYPQHYKSVSENMQIGGIQPYGCERLYYPPNIYNPYVTNDCSYGYGRKYFSIYNVPSSNIFSGPYNYNIMYSKRKGGQVRFTPNQTDVLEKRFMSNKYLSPEDRKRLADNLKLSDRQVKTWFQNRRAKWRRSTSTSSSEPLSETDKSAEQRQSLRNAVASNQN